MTTKFILDMEMPVITVHLVLSTVHAEDALGCLYRLVEFGLSIQEIEQTLLGIVSQRLLSLLCPYCGDQCESYCFMQRHNKRIGLYELLSESGLEKGMEWIRGNSDRPEGLRTLNYYMKQGMALGYLPMNTLYRWGVGR
ncbi:ATPase, T2SS/T4P/T4SS family [Fictibacillus fluitans]|uniref:ATPase, T2SS/T4P/T4SS family n=1 Tax=Fictibacillus fluitans TaxID=3058422 RepID=A0ABT8HWZ5_9BACL|nr:ATPase, T2SS/T4P/T4SS family [Fictibacillus sp. NE201]MDN4525307.1 ATPase, T2SS/T4P/T4SS family [Fictibacillus sp. NE201]